MKYTFEISYLSVTSKSFLSLLYLPKSTLFCVLSWRCEEK